MSSQRHSLPLAFALLGACLVSGSAVAAPVFHPDLTEDAPDASPGDGKCSIVANPGMDEAVCTLRAAVMEVNATPAMPGERAEIHLVPGAIYTLAIPRSATPLSAASGDLDLTKPVYIGVSDTVAAPAVIDGGSLDRIFNVVELASGSELQRLELRNGNADATTVSAINLFGAELTLRAIDVHGNLQSTFGCVVVNFGGTLSLIETSIRDNIGDTRALCALGGGSVALERSAIHGNAGTAVYAINDAIASIAASTLSTDAGSLLSLQNASVEVTYSTLKAGGSAELLHFSIAPGRSGNLSVFGTAFASRAAGGASACSVTIEGSSMVTAAWNMSDDSSCALDPMDTTSTVETDLGLSALAAAGGPTQSMLPLADSVLIDRIPPGACFDALLDQRGKPRPVGYFDGDLPMCDVGAVELETPPEIFADGFE